jgi:hypothetical protein
MNNKKVKTKKINLSSINAIKNNGTMNSDVTIKLPVIVSKSENVIGIYFSVMRCEFPNSFYNVATYNNIVIINDVKYTVPKGNYNVSSLIQMFATILPTFGFGFNFTTNVLSMACATAFTISKNSPINIVIGGSLTDDMIAIYNGTYYSLTLPFCVNFLPAQRIHFRSNQLSMGNYNSADGTNDIFLTVQNDGVPNGMVFYNNNSNFRYQYEKDLSNLNLINIRIGDDFGNLLDLNNQNWTMTVQFDVEYMEDSSNETFSKIIKSVPVILDDA